MEFLPYAETVRSLERHGIIAQPSGDLIRLTLRPPPPGRAGINGSVQRIVLGPNASPAGAAVRAVSIPSDRLAQAAEQLVHLAHLSEFVLIPSGKWRHMLDLVAFDLAANEDWLDIDAEASLHQNGRDPLGIPSKQRHMITALATALFKNAPPSSKGEHDITIASTDSPFLIELRHDATMTLSCVGEGVAANLLARLEA